jgi:hypothetical protein
VQPWSPTHRITFRPAIGEAQLWEVMVLVDPFAPDRIQLAATLEDWAHQWAPVWSRSAAGAWTWKGLTTPYGMPGQVVIEDVTDDRAPRPDRG